MKLSVRAKIVSGFVIIFIIGMMIGLYSLYSINKIAAMSQSQAEIQNASSAISEVLSAHYIWRQNLTIAVFDNVAFTGSYDPDNCALGKWIAGNEAKKTANDEVLSLLAQIDRPHRYIHEQARSIMDMMAEGRVEEARQDFMNNVLPSANEAISLLTKMTEAYALMLQSETETVHAFQNETLTVIVSMIVLATFLCIVLSIVSIKSILHPLRQLTQSAEWVAQGNFNVNLSYAVQDEIGKVTNAFSVVVGTFRKLVEDLNHMAKKHSLGDIEYFIADENYQGEFRNVAHGVNVMVEEYTQNINDMLSIVGKYADGSFNAKLAPLPGKKAVANRVLDTVSNNLTEVDESIMKLVRSVLAGELDTRIDASGFRGDWQAIIEGMNSLLEAVNTPLYELNQVLAQVSNGHLDVKITGKYNGRFAEMSNATNKTIEILSSYITEISATLTKLAADDFNTGITREYVGSFAHIKQSLNAIINRLNQVMREIGMAADQVSLGANQISESSMNLSDGASKQASAVEELNTAMEEIHHQTTMNADNATDANRLASAVTNDAKQGSDRMKDMLVSMNEINAASQNISKIMKAMNDIAFQTNLLALNAAVEAARAGTNGKGFAVVAEEVRNLAEKSQKSAKDSAALIEHSMEKVNEGTLIANDTAAALNKIVNGVDSVSGIINKIETASKEQSVSIAQVSEGTGQISQVTQSNLSTSEESAAAAQELSSQSEMLNNMLKKFTLKRI